ncbi:hypothetical protein GCM10027033_21090 [Leucobacter ruminantium]|nr:DNA-processing protein DprA [Leucobacter ruminantium]
MTPPGRTRGLPHTGLAALGERAPLALWTRGRNELIAEGIVSRLTITGTRAPSRYGNEIARDFTYALVEQGIIIVSGAAYGIDGIAHHAALTIDRDTIGVLASSIDRPYPASNTSQIRRIGDDGLLITETPPGAPPPTVTRVQQRARLLAALSGATLIVEAAEHCESLRVADHALALGRPVAAIPGPITAGVSGGCHLLIGDGRARLVSTPEDVAQLCAGANSRPPAPLPPVLDEPAALTRERSGAGRLTRIERIAS